MDTEKRMTDSGVPVHTRNQVLAVRAIVEIATRPGEDTSIEGLAKRLGLDKNVVADVLRSDQYRALLDTEIARKARSVMGKGIHRLEEMIERAEGDLLVKATRAVHDAVRTLHATSQSHEGDAAEIDLEKALHKLEQRNKLKRADITFHAPEDPKEPQNAPTDR